MAKRTRWHRLGKLIAYKQDEGYDTAAVVVYPCEVKRLKAKGIAVEVLKPYENSENLLVAKIFWTHLSRKSVHEIAKNMQCGF